MSIVILLILVKNVIFKRIFLNIFFFKFPEINILKVQTEKREAKCLKYKLWYLDNDQPVNNQPFHHRNTLFIQKEAIFLLCCEISFDQITIS